ncbi:MAG: phosphoadenylyl-sulfate reductase [Pseudomonadota bacterium]
MLSLLYQPNEQRGDLIADANTWLGALDAESRVEWALNNLPAGHAVSSSFGVQSAVMLHMMTQKSPDIPILVMDTGYLFPETYQFIDELTERLGLNLHIYRSEISPAWQEAKYGQLWTKGEEGIKRYNTMNKVEPMQRALKELGVSTWFSGLRRDQSESRASRQFIEMQHGRIKVHPIVDWSSRDIYVYLKAHDLPYHPLWEEGYVSVGDTHTTRKLEDGMTEEETRFFGLARECGLHVDASPDVGQ